MADLTIGHYASHKTTRGYTPPKTDGPKTQFPPKSGSVETPPKTNLLITDEDVIKAISDMKHHPSELELRIRREVMDTLDELLKEEEEGEVYFTGLLTKIKGHLILLWGDQK